MGIEKMSLLTIEGPVGDLDGALMACCRSREFQMSSNGSVLRNLNEQNPYQGTYSKIHDMAVNLKIEPVYCDFSKIPYESARSMTA